MLMVLLCSNAFASPAQEVFDQAKSYLETQYFGPSSVNMLEHTAKYQPVLDEACKEDKETCTFDKAEPVIAKMLFDLQDKHAYYISKADLAQRAANSTGNVASPVARIGITHQGFCNTPTGDCERDELGNIKSPQIYDRLISNVVPGSPAEKVGLMYGDRWVGYNDILFSSASDVKIATEQRAAFTKIVQAQQPVTMKIIRGIDRQDLDIVVTGVIINTVNLPTMTLRSDGVGVLLIRDWLVQGLGVKIHGLVKQAIDKNASAIVIDQRDNGGGYPSERAIAQGAFFEKSENILRVPRYEADKNTVVERYENGVYAQLNLQGTVLGSLKIDNPVLFQGSVVMLVNKSCASACEYFASAIQRAKRGSIIGEETAGIGNTNTYPFALMNGGAASMPTVRAFWADGTPLPSSVKPDIATPNYEFNLFNTGVDQPLQKALESFGAKASANVSSITLSPLLDFTGSSVMDSLMQRVSGNLEVAQNTANLQ